MSGALEPLQSRVAIGHPIAYGLLEPGRCADRLDRRSASETMSDPNSKNRSRKLNPNNETYWRGRGLPARPAELAGAWARMSGKSGGGKGQGNGGGWPSTTGGKSGGGRSNGPRGK